MIGSVRGLLLHRTASELVVEVSGLGYRVTVSPGTVAACGPLGSEVFLWTHHQVREDASILYGFPTIAEREVFETLISTHGVGPALGLAILSVYPPDQLRHVLAVDDVAALCAVPGVGRKTAARLLVELKPRLAVGEADIGALSDGGPSSAPSPRADVRDALVGLGYASEEVAEVMRRLPEEGDSSELLREALQLLATV